MVLGRQLIVAGRELIDEGTSSNKSNSVQTDWRARVGEYIISVRRTPGVQNVEFQFHMKVEMNRKIIPCHKQKCMRGSI